MGKSVNVSQEEMSEEEYEDYVDKIHQLCLEDDNFLQDIIREYADDHSRKDYLQFIGEEDSKDNDNKNHVPEKCRKPAKDDNAEKCDGVL